MRGVGDRARSEGAWPSWSLCSESAVTSSGSSGPSGDDWPGLWVGDFVSCSEIWEMRQTVTPLERIGHLVCQEWASRGMM